MGLYSNGNIELWGYTAVGTLSCGAIQLWEHRTMGLYSCGNIEMWGYTAVGTLSYGAMVLWEHRT